MYSTPKTSIYLEIFDTQGQRKVVLTKSRYVLGSAATCDVQLYTKTWLGYQTTLVWNFKTYRAIDVDLNVPNSTGRDVDLRDGDRIIFANDAIVIYHCPAAPPPKAYALVPRPTSPLPTLPSREVDLDR
jgi:hypothetical protein